MLFDQGTHAAAPVARRRPDRSRRCRAPGSATPFETLALFSPDATLMLTAGAAEGRLQLWRRPTDERPRLRGAPVRHRRALAGDLRRVLRRRRRGRKSASPSPASKDGNVYLWPMPTQEEVATHRIENVPLTLISQNVDPGTRQIRIGFEVANPRRPSLHPGPAGDDRDRLTLSRGLQPRGDCVIPEGPHRGLIRLAPGAQWNGPTTAPAS